jgi:hypothetical protein
MIRQANNRFVPTEKVQLPSCRQGHNIQAAFFGIEKSPAISCKALIVKLIFRLS